MGFRALNRKRNLAIRAFKAKFAGFLLDKKNKNRFTPSKLKEIKKILFLRHDNKIGDMIVSTLAFREIKKALPKAEITVLAGENSAEVIENNHNISKIIVYKNQFFEVFKLALDLRKQHFDLIIDMDDEPKWQSFVLLRLAKTRYLIGFNRKHKLYNINIPFKLDSAHITQRHQAVFTALKLGKIDRSYDIFVPKTLKAQAAKFIESLPRAKKNIIVNPFAASHHKNFCADQLNYLAEKFSNYNFILIGNPSDLAKLESCCLAANIFRPDINKNSLFYSFALINQGDLLLTPDTSMLHAAVAFNKPIIAIYRGTKKDNLLNVWGPNTTDNKVFITEEDFCKFDFKQIAQALKEF